MVKQIGDLFTNPLSSSGGLFLSLRRVIDHFVDQSLVSAIVHNDQDAEGTIRELIGGDVAAEFA